MKRRSFFGALLGAAAAPVAAKAVKAVDGFASSAELTSSSVSGMHHGRIGGHDAVMMWTASCPVDVGTYPFPDDDSQDDYPDEER